MSAKDYKICPACFNIYIAKVSKKDPRMMLNDRRPLEEHEILGIIEWYAREYCIRHKTDEFHITKRGQDILSVKISGGLFDEVKKAIKEGKQ